MRRFYVPRPAEGALPAGQPPRPGASVAVRWQGGWHRGTVLTAAEDHAEVSLRVDGASGGWEGLL